MTDSPLPRAFLPERDPLVRFRAETEAAMLDDLGGDLPSLLMDSGFRARATAWRLPPPGHDLSVEELRLYYVRVGFLASAFINQVGQAPARVLPRSLAVPLREVCSRLARPPILSYDGYALYNWKRFNPQGEIALGNIDTIQNFIHLYDEHWFILVHVEIEAIAQRVTGAIAEIESAHAQGDGASITAAFAQVAQAEWEMVRVLRRIPEKMDPLLYYKTFRPYIRFFEGVIYEGVDEAPVNYRGETGAQSAVVPALVCLYKIPHRPSSLTNHLAEMRRFMPWEHREYLERLERLPDFRAMVQKDVWNDGLEALATFRETHLGFAREYIARWVEDPRGTGGTPYLEWLGKLIDETRAHKA